MQSDFLTVPLQDALRPYVDAPAVAISGNGRYVAFASYAPLVQADTNRHRDVYVLDRDTGRITLESVSPDGRAGEDTAGHPSISHDGRFLVYQTMAGTGPARAISAVLRDREAGTSTSIVGGPPSAYSGAATISADGRFVAFVSTSATNTSGSDANGYGDDVYVLEVRSGSIERISVDSQGRQRPYGASFAPAISADGRFVAFTSTAPLDSGHGPDPVIDRPRAAQIYVRDRTRNVTTLVSAVRNSQGNGPSWSAVIDATGRHVAFVSTASNLTQDDRGGGADIFVADLEARTIDLITRNARGGPGNGPSGSPALSADGQRVAFQSEASDLMCARACAPETEDINLLPDVLVFDRRSRIVRRVSGGATGWLEASVGPAVDASGTVVAFLSRHPIDAADTKNDYDLFIRSAARSSDRPAPRVTPADRRRPPPPR